jgi:hypothetical protein
MNEIISLDDNLREFYLLAEVVKDVTNLILFEPSNQGEMPGLLSIWIPH